MSRIKDYAKQQVRDLIDRHDYTKNGLQKEGRYTHSMLSEEEIEWLWQVAFRFCPTSINVKKILSIRPGVGQHGTVAFYVDWIHVDGSTIRNEFWAWSKYINKASYIVIPNLP